MQRFCPRCCPVKHHPLDTAICIHFKMQFRVLYDYVGADYYGNENALVRLCSLSTASWLALRSSARRSLSLQ